ncbi:centriolin-like isoform X1 [Octopus sinensis]|uniref:Centriolin-like isoform X1 n=1 Tax=Octopus sinensis TaxID=2607531 RepID=A0A7E6FK16_9MOLL|nr:centriolin-like isoform X1 [Octopus sinensis]
MLGKEEEYIQQLAATEAHAAHWESQAKQQQQQYSEELKGKHLENNLHKAQQQACIQVISQDLDNARRTADDLQKLLDERQKQLQSELENANMSEQMIAGQEEELSHLYNILEQQRDEISNLNGALDQLYGQNPDARGSSYDAEVNRLRDEVNSLRETLAMQSSYMENMPKFSTGTSTDPHLPQTQPTLPQVSNAQYISDDPGHFNGFQAFPSDNDYQISPSPFNQTAAPQVPLELSPTLQQVSPPKNVYIQPQPVSVNSKDRRMDMAYIPSKQPSNFGSILVQPDHVGSESVQQFTNEAEQYDAPDHPVPEKSTTVHLTPHANRNLDIAPQNPFHADIISSGNSPTWQGVTTKFPSNVVTSSPKIIQPFQTQPILYVASPEKADHRNHTQAGAITQKISSQPVKNSCLLTPGVEEHLIQPENSMYPVNPTGSHYQNYNPLKTVSFKQPFVQSTSESHDTADSNLTGTLLPRRPIRFTSGSQYREPYRHSVNHQPQQLYTVTNHQPQQLYTEIEQQPQQLYSTTNQRQQLFNSTNYQTQQPQPLYNTSHQPQQVHNTASHQPQQPYTASNHQPQQLHAVSSYQPQQIFTTANNEPQKLYSVQAPIHPQAPPDVQTHMHPSGNIQYHTAIPGPPVASSSPVNLHTKDYGRQHGKQFSPIKTVLESNVQPTFPSRTCYHPEHEGMFCNIPEHSNLEHLVDKLQRKLARWKSRFQYQMQREEADTLQKKSKLMYKLKEQLEERRNELEALDLAIERQKRNQEKMMKEERQLMRDHKVAKEELLRLQQASSQNRKRKHIPNNYIETDSSSDSSFEDRESYKKQLKLQDELKCLEKTLFKRQAQLKDADAQLKEYKQNLNEAKLQAEETVRKHDSASSSLHTVRKETRELEERANKAGLQVITESGNLKRIKTEYKEMQQKKSTLEKVLADINVIISEKDMEFRKLDSKIQTSNQRLQLVQRELTVTSEAEREATKSLINSKETLEKTKLEISKLREQDTLCFSSFCGQENGEILALQVKDLNKHVCQKQKELSNIQEDLGRKKSDIDNLLREAQTAVVLKQRELKACHEKLVKLEGCHLELATVTRNKKGELEEVTKELEKQRQAASILNENINEEKQNLQTAIDQRKIVQANTDALKNQMEQKYAELEKTFKHLSEEKLNLSNLVKETDHHKKELKLLQQSVIEERSCSDKLIVERSNLQEKVSSLSREHNQLVKDHSEFDTKLNEAKTELCNVETTIKEKTSHLNSLRDDIQHEEDYISQCQSKKTMLETELESLQENISERQKELNMIEKSLQDAEIQMSNSKEKSEQINSANIDSQVILDHLTSEIKQQRILRCNQQNQVKVLQKQLEQLTYSFEEKTTEMEKISMINSEAREKLDSVMSEIKEAENQLQELRNKIGIFQKHSTEIKDVEQLKNELKIDVKLLNEQKSSLELHLNELKKDITRQLFLEHQPEKENLGNIIRYNDEEWRREALKEKLIEEQDHVRMQLQQKMHHHFDVLDSTKQQSEGVLNKLKHKLNILQDVFISNKGP